MSNDINCDAHIPRKCQKLAYRFNYPPAGAPPRQINEFMRILRAISREYNLGPLSEHLTTTEGEKREGNDKERRPGIRFASNLRACTARCRICLALIQLNAFQRCNDNAVTLCRPFFYTVLFYGRPYLARCPSQTARRLATLRSMYGYCPA
ncbi:hypothetical protein Trydic_g3759 [Trypoxylus dichotomus]